uniref:Arf-GAP with coiled-coil, ANK repeat and PH domain-containing protein n=1 Tax=Oncorhynchus mykiss TaxID=8022 RepID=A0A8C7PQX6_ONCMY
MTSDTTATDISTVDRLALCKAAQHSDQDGVEVLDKTLCLWWCFLMCRVMWRRVSVFSSRADIEVVEGDVSELETRLEKLVKQCHSMLEAGRAYCQTSKSFVTGLKDHTHAFMGHIHSSLSPPPPSPRDVRRFKDVRKEFERGSESLEAALGRNAQAPRGKQHEVEEASHALLNARKTFRSGALDYVLQVRSSKLDESVFWGRTKLVLNSAREKRDMEQRHAAIKKKDVSYDNSLMDFCADAPNGIAMEGYLYKRASNAFKTWSRRWFSIQKNQLVYQKKFKEQPTVVMEDLRLCTVKVCADNERRFCFEVVSPSKSCLLQADSERQQQGWISAVQNSIASAFQERREDPHSPVRTHTPYSLCEKTGGREALDQVQGIPGNKQCCDCGEPGPDWASINLGITLCIVCSGIHRSLGVHFSKVRSLTLDSWEPELVRLMCELGNTAINRIYEARIDEITIKKPHPSSPRGDKESWIRSKFVEKKFIQKLPETGRNIPLRRSSARRNRANTQERPAGSRPPLKPKPNRATLPRLPGTGRNIHACLIYTIGPSRAVPGCTLNTLEDLSGLHPGALLYRSAALQHFPVMADALAHGADVNWVNTVEESSTPLIQAVTANSLAACEFLLQNGANVNTADSNGRGPLHHATILGHTGLVCLFLKRGADYNARDHTQKDPITIAVETANADIVTLLRIAKMNKEMREMDGAFGQPGDETYQDIFRDFSHMASNNPEKLKRRSTDFKT